MEITEFTSFCSSFLAGYSNARAGNFRLCKVFHSSWTRDTESCQLKSWHLAVQGRLLVLLELVLLCQAGLAFQEDGQPGEAVDVVMNAKSRSVLLPSQTSGGMKHESRFFAASEFRSSKNVFLCCA